MLITYHKAKMFSKTASNVHIAQWIDTYFDKPKSSKSIHEKACMKAYACHPWAKIPQMRTLSRILVVWWLYLLDMKYHYIRTIKQKGFFLFSTKVHISGRLLAWWALILLEIKWEEVYWFSWQSLADKLRVTKISSKVDIACICLRMGWWWHDNNYYTTKSS